MTVITSTWYRRKQIKCKAELSSSLSSWSGGNWKLDPSLPFHWINWGYSPWQHDNVRTCYCQRDNISTCTLVIHYQFFNQSRTDFLFKTELLKFSWLLNGRDKRKASQSLLAIWNLNTHKLPFTINAAVCSGWRAKSQVLPEMNFRWLGGTLFCTLSTYDIKSPEGF